jgi:hypothetical protein
VSTLLDDNDNEKGSHYKLWVEIMARIAAQQAMQGAVACARALFDKQPCCKAASLSLESYANDNHYDSQY